MEKKNEILKQHAEQAEKENALLSKFLEHLAAFNDSISALIRRI